MTCSEVQRVLPEFLDDASDVAIHTDFEAHLKSCPDCSDLVSDLRLISSEARQLATSEEPAPRVWARIAAELRSEGLVREPGSSGPVLVPTSPGRRWSALWLAPVAAALVAAGTYVVNHKPIPEPTPALGKQQAPANTVTPAAPDTPVVASHSESNPAPQHLAEKSSQPTDIGGSSAGTGAGPGAGPAAGSAIASAVEPEPSAEDQQFLSAVSTLAPSTRATYESQLQAVNADIRESQAYLDRNPGDPDARQHLMDAYQQKALLYQIALDRIQ
jgi:hypothetical protein